MHESIACNVSSYFSSFLSLPIISARRKSGKVLHYFTLFLTNRAVVIFNVTKVFCNRCENLFVFAAKSHCHPNPCLHGGSCVDIKDGYTCKCPGSYRGTNCEGITINSLQPRDNRDLKIGRRRRRRQRERQNNNFARTSRFFVHFFAVTARLRRETTEFNVL